MTRYWLPPHVHACITNECTVFLDLKLNKYVGLDEHETQHLRNVFAHGVELDSDDQSLARALVEQHLLTSDESFGRPFHPVAIESPDRPLFDFDSAESLERPHFGPTHVLKFTRAYFATIAVLRMGSLQRAIHRIQHIRNQAAQEGWSFSPRTSGELVKTFRLVRSLFYTAHDNCLIDSLVLLDFLRRFQQRVTFVVGVRTTPFSAHCWLQEANFAVNDRPEYVQKFSPIVVI